MFTQTLTFELTVLAIICAILCGSFSCRHIQSSCDHVMWHLGYMGVT